MRRALAAALGVAALLLAGTPQARAAGTPSVRAQLSRARLVVAGRVTSLTSYDAGRVVVARIAVQKTVKGKPQPPEVLAVEMRDLPSTPPVFREGEQGVLLLETAARSSYLARNLPTGSYLQASHGRQGMLVSPKTDEAAEVVAIVERIADESRAPEPDGARRAEVRRTLLFDELAARHPALVEDAALGLGGIRGLAKTLSDEERARLESALRRGDLPPRVRATLVRQVGAVDLAQLTGVLERLPGADAEVLEASWEARGRLGSPPTAAEVLARSADRDPAVRAAAARQLLRIGGAEAMAQVSRMALSDTSPQVRLAALEALGTSGRPEAIPVLEQAFADPSWEIRQATGRAILALGGRTALESFARLCFAPPVDAQRYAITLLLAAGAGGDDPLVEKVATSHPDEEVREIARHGLPFHEH